MFNTKWLSGILQYVGLLFFFAGNHTLFDHLVFGVKQRDLATQLKGFSKYQKYIKLEKISVAKVLFPTRVKCCFCSLKDTLQLSLDFEKCVQGSMGRFYSFDL